jgi:FG-GAP-like repeat/IPT/TIG domain/Secretion system C-terminal sorting domain
VNEGVIYDMNNDGKLDLALARHNVSLTGNSDLVILVNNSSSGTIAFNAPQTFFTIDPMMQLVAGDLNIDGKPDIAAVCNVCGITNGGFAVAFLNTSSGGNLAFTATRIFFSTSTPGNTVMNGIELRDLNKDNKQEIMIGATGGGTDALIILKNNAISFSTIVIGSFYGSPYFCTIPFADDLDADGITDVVATNVINIHTGNFNFNRQTNISIGAGVTADLNGDGKPEIVCQGTVASNTSDKISVFKNSSTPSSVSFVAPVHYAGNNTYMKVVAGDLDGDGKPEIASSNMNLNNISIYRNRIAEPALPSPTITSFTPTSAAQSAQVTITGTNFSQATNVSFGNVTASFFTVVSPTTIIATVANGVSGSVSVITPGGTVSLPGFTYLSIPTPTITSFTPTNGTTGVTITITGTDYTGATAISFGGTPASSFTVVNATTITAVVGTGASGSVSVTTPGGTTSLAGFTFIPAPSITSFTPTSAATGATITITGTNFTGATAVSFGGVAATSFVGNSSTSITAIVASGASGNVSVTTPGGTATLAGFTFIPAPVISSFTPASAATGATITITGTSFTGATAVNFGGVAATSFVVNSSTSITAIVGAGATGNVSVTTPGGTATATGFTYNAVTGIGGPGSINSNELIVNPNPAKDFLIIKYPATNKNAELNFYDILGRKIKTILPARNSRQTDVMLNYMTPGIYTIVWSDGISVLSRIVVIN